MNKDIKSLYIVLYKKYLDFENTGDISNVVKLLNNETAGIKIMKRLPHSRLRLFIKSVCGPLYYLRSRFNNTKYVSIKDK